MQISGLHLCRLVIDHKDVIADMRPLFVVDYQGGRNGRLFFISFCYKVPF
jgi:hypothetical protein